MNALQTFDQEQITQLQAAPLIGIDEAGRGPLAGPVVACACIISPKQYDALQDVNDSKKLSAQKRETIFQIINDLHLTYGVGVATAQEIDTLNILQATFLAMRRAAEKFYSLSSAVALVDGNHAIRDFPLRQIPVIDGDAKSLHIATASIIAKVTRDHYMMQLDRQYPQYGFAGHKGYGTAQHIAAIEKYGPCPEHRTTFAPLRQMLAPSLFS